MQKGLIHVYCGSGKGKTTAAIGLAVRCAGRGFKVMYTAFLKNYNSGELINQNRFDVFRFNPIDGFWRDFSEEKRKALSEEMMRQLEAVFAKSREYDLIVLDEILNAITVNAIDENYFLNLLQTRSNHTEFVLTGRKVTEAVSNAADYITEMKCIRHPYEHGENARIGIEY